MREAEMADLKKEVDEMTEAASGLSDFDPMGDVQKEIESAIDDKPPEPSAAAADQPAASASPEAAASSAPAPGSPDNPIPKPAPAGAEGASDAAMAPQAPQPKKESKEHEAKSGSGA
jgi:sec-independent protein translocase protein TatB